MTSKYYAAADFEKKCANCGRLEKEHAPNRISCKKFTLSSEKCANCGYPEDNHTRAKYDMNNKMIEHCEKFTPEEDEPTNLGIWSVKREKKKKGCGKEFLLPENTKLPTICQRNWLCPSCSNQSPSTSSITKGGNYSSAKFQPEGTKTLSSKINDWKMITNKRVRNIDDLTKAHMINMIENVEDDVKDFIKKNDSFTEEEGKTVICEDTFKEGFEYAISRMKSLVGDKLLI